METRSARQHFAAEQRAQVIQDYWQARLLSQKEFAAQAGFGVTTLQSWPPKAAGAQRTQRPKSLPVPNLLGAAVARAAYRLHLAGGMQLEVCSVFRPEELTTPLRVAEAALAG